MTKRIMMFVLTCMVFVLSSCGSGPQKLDLKKTGGIYMVYQLDKDGFTYEDEYEEGLNLMAYMIRQRLTAYCIPEVYVNQDKICVEIPKEQDAAKYQEIIEKRAEMYFIRQYDDNGNANFEKNDGIWNLTKTIDVLLADGSVGLSGKDINSAEARTYQDDKKNNQIVVSLVMTEEGTKKYEDMTREAYNNDNARIAIWYDGKILEIPVVRAIISDGQAIVEGFNSYEEAEDMASFIRIGPMPYKIHQISCEVFERKRLEK